MDETIKLETQEAIDRGWLQQVGEDDRGPLYQLTQAGVLRAAIKQALQGWHGGRGYNRTMEYLEMVLRTTEEDFPA